MYCSNNFTLLFVILFLFTSIVNTQAKDLTKDEIAQENRKNFQKWLDKHNLEIKEIQRKLPQLIEKLKTGTFLEKTEALSLMGLLLPEWVKEREKTTERIVP
jgi:hypothetical protein